MFTLASPSRIVRVVEHHDGTIVVVAAAVVVVVASAGTARSPILGGFVAPFTKHGGGSRRGGAHAAAVVDELIAQFVPRIPVTLGAEGVPSIEVLGKGGFGRLRHLFRLGLETRHFLNLGSAKGIEGQGQRRFQRFTHLHLCIGNLVQHLNICIYIERERDRDECEQQKYTIGRHRVC